MVGDQSPRDRRPRRSAAWIIHPSMRLHMRRAAFFSPKVHLSFPAFLGLNFKQVAVFLSGQPKLFPSWPFVRAQPKHEPQMDSCSFVSQVHPWASRCAREACLCEEMETVEQMFDQLIWGTFCLFKLDSFISSPHWPGAGKGGLNVCFGQLELRRKVWQCFV